MVNINNWWLSVFSLSAWVAEKKAIGTTSWACGKYRRACDSLQCESGWTEDTVSQNVTLTQTGRQQCTLLSYVPLHHALDIRSIPQKMNLKGKTYTGSPLLWTLVCLPELCASVSIWTNQCMTEHSMTTADPATDFTHLTAMWNSADRRLAF